MRIKVGIKERVEFLNLGDFGDRGSFIESEMIYKLK